jgi:YggT family protein
MMIIFVRIILTWFSWLRDSKIRDYLAVITDPYLNWFRRFTFLRIGYLDLSPIAAIAALSLANRLLTMLSLQGRISIGIILALFVQAVWGVASFILGFLIVALILYLIRHLLRLNSYNPFWNIVNSISQPVIYKIISTVFKDRILHLTTSVIISIATLGIIYLILRILVAFVSGMLIRLPL